MTEFKLVPEEIFSSIATIYKDLMAMGCANTANKLLAVGVQLETLQSPAHDGEVVYLIYHGDGECAVDEVSKADYDEHEGPKRILYTAPPRVVDGLLRESAEIITELCNAYGHPFPQATLDRIQAALEKP